MVNKYGSKSKVCVVTVTYGDRFHLLKQVIKSCFNEGVEKVIVVDNASVENSRKQLVALKNKYQNKLDIIHLNENIGSAGGYKKGLEKAYKCTDCDFIWLLDDDNKPVRGSLKKYVDIYSQLKSQNVSLGALVGFRKLRPQYVKAVEKCDGTHLLEPLDSFIGFHIFHYWKKWVDKFSFLRFQNMKNCNLVKIPTASYGGLFFERKLLKKIGFPNDNYYLYEDDTDFTYRITKSGYNIYLVPEIEIIDLDEYWCAKDKGKKHPYFSGTEFRFYYFIRNKLFFQKKYRVKNKKIFNLNKFIYFGRMLILSFIHRNIRRFHLFRGAVKDALEDKMKKKKMKILFISHVLDGSGAPRSLLSLIKDFPRKELDLYLLALRRNDLEKEFKEILNKDPIIITRNPPSNKFLKLIERVLTIPRLIYYLWRINPDLVFINSAANSRAILFSKLLGYKIYLFVREFDKEFAFLPKIRRKFINFADKVFCLSNTHENWLREKVNYRKKIIILPNGINLDEVRTLSLEEPEGKFRKFVKKFNFVIANVGYLSIRKGWDYLLMVIEQLKDEKDIGFVIIGDFLEKKDKERFLHRLRELKLENRVYITGITENVFKYLKYCHLTAITSRSEVFPRVALESMSLGIPVVFFDVGAIKTIVYENYKYKVKPFNIDEFTSHILEIKMLNYTNKTAGLKSMLIERAKKFDIKNISAKFYNEILKEKEC